MPKYIVIAVGGSLDVSVQPLSEFNMRWEKDGISITPPEMNHPRWFISHLNGLNGTQSIYAELGIFIRSQVGAAHFLTIFDLDDQAQLRRTFINLASLHIIGGMQV